MYKEIYQCVLCFIPPYAGWELAEYAASIMAATAITGAKMGKEMGLTPV